MKIWTLATWLAGLCVSVVIAMAVFTEKTFHVEIVIPAPPAAVWSVLTDSTAYKEWNPVFVNVEGAFREGEEVESLVREPDGDEIAITSTIVKLIPEREINQYGGLPGFITFDHKWLLEPVDGGTKVIQHEVDRGFWVWFWDSNWVEPAYAEANEALRERVLQLAE